MPFTPPNYYGTIGSNFLGGNPAAFFTNPNLGFPIDFSGMSTTTPTAGAPGNLNGMKKDSYQRALGLLSNPVFQSLLFFKVFPNRYSNNL
jgi:hypothetical protein